MASSRYVIVDEDFQLQVLRYLQEIKALHIYEAHTNPIKNDGLMDSVDAMEYFKITRRTLATYRDLGLPSFKIGGKVYFKRSEVEKFINQKKLDS